MNKKKYIYSILLNTIVLLSTIIIVYNGVTSGAGKGQVGIYLSGPAYFIPYTVDSNVLCALASLVMIVFSIRCLMNKKSTIPKWATTFKLAGATSLSLTFIVVTIFLGPIQVLQGRSYFNMFAGEMIFLHLLNPLIAAYSIMFIEKENKLDKKDHIIALIPTIIYAIVYTTMVVILKRWVDFYYFTFGGRYYLIPIVYIFILSIIYFTTKLFIKKHNKK